MKQTVPLLYVSDLAQSSKFYVSGLGFEMVEKWEPDGKLSWCWLRRGGAAVMLQQDCADDPPAAERGKGVVFYFICDDAQEYFQEITERGIQASKPSVSFHGMNQTMVKDLDGYQLCFENLQ